MKNIKKNLLMFILTGFIVCLPLLSFAQGVISNPNKSGGVMSDPTKNIDTNITTTKIINPIKANDINTLIKDILEGVIKIGIPIIALAIIYSGFLFVAARGNTEKIGKAKDSLLYTLIGAAILLGAWTIAQLVRDTVLQIK